MGADDQHDLFGKRVAPNKLAPFQKHSPTSRESAIKIMPKSLSHRQRVYNCIKKYGPITDDDMQVRLSMNPSTQRPRRIELQDAGLVAEVEGERGKTRSGRTAALWCVTLPVRQSV